MTPRKKLANKINFDFTATEIVVLLSVLIAVSSVTAGYYYIAKVKISRLVPVVVISSAPKIKTLNVNLEPQAGATRQGMAVLAEVSGKVTVVVNLSGNGDVSRPAHIHAGECTKVGAVKYPLANLENGYSETNLDIPLHELLSQKPLAINVHKSSAELSVYIACGNIE